MHSDFEENRIKENSSGTGKPLIQRLPETFPEESEDSEEAGVLPEFPEQEESTGEAEPEEEADEEEPEEGPDRREIVEREIFIFLRYFFPAVGPLMIYIGVVLACLCVGAFIFHLGMPLQQFAKEMTNVYASLGVIITFLILRKNSRRAGSTFFEDATLYRHNLDWKKILLCVFFGIGAALGLSALISLMPSVGIIADYEDSVANVYQRWSVILSMIFNTFFTPLVEEVVFRGYMLNRLLPHWGEKKALLVTSVVFALMHGSILWVLYAFVMGWIIGKVSILEDNIFYAIVLHIGFNLPSAVIWFMYLTVPGARETMDTNQFLVFLLGVLGVTLAAFCFNSYRRLRKYETPVKFT